MPAFCIWRNFSSGIILAQSGTTSFLQKQIGFIIKFIFIVESSKERVFCDWVNICKVFIFFLCRRKRLAALEEEEKSQDRTSTSRSISTLEVWKSKNAFLSKESLKSCLKYKHSCLFYGSFEFRIEFYDFDFVFFKGWGENQGCLAAKKAIHMFNHKNGFNQGQGRKGQSLGFDGKSIITYILQEMVEKGFTKDTEQIVHTLGVRGAITSWILMADSQKFRFSTRFMFLKFLWKTVQDRN